MLVTEISIARFTQIDPKCNQVVPWSLHTFPENFMQIGLAVSSEYKTSQTTDRQTDETTHCTKGATDSTVGQKQIQHFICVSYDLISATVKRTNKITAATVTTSTPTDARSSVESLNTLYSQMYT